MKRSDVTNRLALILGTVFMLSCKAATAGLVAYWPFDGDPKDKVGNRVALLHGGTQYELGYLGKAVQLHGRPDCVELPVGELVGTLSSCTFALWVNPSDEDSAWYRIFSFGRDPAVDLYLTGNATPPNALQLFIGNGEPHRWLPASYALRRGWHHVAVVLDAEGQRCTIYLDGVAVMLEVNLPPSLIPGKLGRTTENWLGYSPYAQGSYFKGALDEMMIFDHALTESEVRLLYQSSGAAFLIEGADALADTVERATWSLTTGEPRRAEAMLREKLIQYAAQAPKLPEMSHATMEAPLGAMYALLAEAHRASGGSNEDVVKLLARSMQLAGRNEPYALSVLSLFHQVPREEYVALIRQSLQANVLTPHHLSGIAQTFHACRQWDAFETFLGVVLEHSLEPGVFALAAETAVRPTTWFGRLENYLATVPHLGEFLGVRRVEHAQWLMWSQRYSEATVTCRNLLKASSVPQEQARWEFESIQCAFLQGHYAQAASLVDAYLGRYPTVPVRQLKRALLLKASALLGQREVDGAIRACLRAIAVPPETEEDREAHYLIGYCQVLQGRKEQARETFDGLSAAYPGSSQAGRSRLLLGRIGRASP